MNFNNNKFRKVMITSKIRLLMHIKKKINKQMTKSKMKINKNKFKKLMMLKQN